MNYSNYYSQLMKSLAEEYEFDLNTPFKNLDEYAKRIILYGTDGRRIKISYRSHKGKIRNYYLKFEGLTNNLSRRYLETESESQRIKIEKLISNRP